MKQSIISIGLILFSIAVLYAKATSTCSCSCGGHDESRPRQAPLVKQCTFKNLDDGQDKGQIQDMLSTLVSITINGKECSSPAPIDAVIYANGVSNLNHHRPGTLDGFCNNIPKGKVTVGLSVGKCTSYDGGDAYTCWNSVCRLIIEEIPSMQ
ncbi:Hypothetical predicted protein [Paramuricea clavata]|uniref:CTHRC1 C-terminal domain-containing protein n=1 Tax=Paramuricea clavata TaxID=317549 RepID=A0A7D9HMD6_PARCT|nr:Hypothetical predicted protein [Paramuricea clavata]